MDLPRTAEELLGGSHAYRGRDTLGAGAPGRAGDRDQETAMTHEELQALLDEAHELGRQEAALQTRRVALDERARTAAVGQAERRDPGTGLNDAAAGPGRTPARAGARSLDELEAAVLDRLAATDAPVRVRDLLRAARVPAARRSAVIKRLSRAAVAGRAQHTAAGIYQRAGVPAAEWPYQISRAKAEAQALSVVLALADGGLAPTELLQAVAEANGLKRASAGPRVWAAKALGWIAEDDGRLAATGAGSAALAAAKDR